MTIQRTREIFGDKISGYSDEQVNEFISNMGLVCDNLLDELIHAQSLTNKEVKGNTNNRQL